MFATAQKKKLTIKIGVFGQHLSKGLELNTKHFKFKIVYLIKQ